MTRVGNRNRDKEGLKRDKRDGMWGRNGKGRVVDEAAKYTKFWLSDNDGWGRGEGEVAVGPTPTPKTVF
jgi:hypothetical protein